MPNGFDNTWGIVKESGGLLVYAFILASSILVMLLTYFLIVFSSSPSAS